MIKFIQITTQSLAVTRRQLLAVDNIDTIIEGVEGTLQSADGIVLKNGTKLYPCETYDQLVQMITGRDTNEL
jgi:hypothetical protein